MTKNIILQTDSYKASHFLQYPPNTEQVFSYIEPRKGGQFNSIVNFGLQAYLIDYLKNPITREQMEEARDVIMSSGLPFNDAGWLHILNKHGGHLPLEVRSLDEGIVIPPGTPQVAVVNTDPKSFWLTSYIETSMLRGIWYPSTVATVSFACKQAIRLALEKSADADRIDGALQFALQDFGARGVSSAESAGLGGLAHTLNFSGTDTLESNIAARRFYGAGQGSAVGYSVPASEHSTMTSWGKWNEKGAYENMLDKFPTGIVSIVADSYDLFNAVNEIFGNDLKAKVVKREGNGRLVIRPDSGDPEIVPIQVLVALGEKFGFTTNSKGYKVLPDYLRVLQGDGINVTSLPRILDNCLASGWSAENLVFGMGGGLLQQVNRDTLRYAMKCSQVTRSGHSHPVAKNPATDPSKASKSGEQAVIYDGFGNFKAVQRYQVRGTTKDLMSIRYFNGELRNTTSLVKIRERVEKGLDRTPIAD